MSESLKIKVCCPYCSNQFFTEGPKGIFTEPIELPGLPYTRDVGRFDPKKASDRFSASGWSKIGVDYLHLFGFERVGILRANHDTRVYYRVQYCPNCENLFDVYANYSKKLTLSQLWPHLMQADPENANQFHRYEGVSWIIWLIRFLENQCSLGKFGILLISLAVFLFGILSWALPGRPSFAQGVPLAFVFTICMSAIASAGIFVILWIKDRYFQYLWTTDDFEKLFSGVGKKGYIYWRNYTLCRFVGVQDEHKFPGLSQVDIYAGGLAVASFLIAWAAIHMAQNNILKVVASAALIGMICAGLYFGLIRLNHARLARTAVQAVILFALGGWGFIWGYRLFGLGLEERWKQFRVANDFLFWLVVAYFLGTAAWMAMNTALYILKGISKNPLKLNPYDNFSRAAPLHQIRKYSTWMIVVLFFLLLTLVSGPFSLNQMLHTCASNPISAVSCSQIENLILQYRWLESWAHWGLALLFVAIGAGFQIHFILVFLLYVAVDSLITLFVPPFLIGGVLMIDPRLVVFSAFLIFILLYHFIITDGIVSGLMKKARDREVNLLNTQIESLVSVIREMGPDCKNFSGSELEEYRVKTQLLQSLISIRDQTEKIRGRKSNKMIEIGSLFLWSLLLPTLWNDLLLRQIFHW